MALPDHTRWSKSSNNTQYFHNLKHQNRLLFARQIMAWSAARAAAVRNFVCRYGGSPWQRAAEHPKQPRESARESSACVACCGLVSAKVFHKLLIVIS